MKKLFYISSMKGINNKTKILCKKSLSKNSTIVVQSYLKETMTSSPPRELQVSRNNPMIHFNLKSKRSHHEPTYHHHRYYNLLTLPKLSTKTGQRLKIVAIKRQGVSSQASLFNKVINQVSGTVINWLPNKDIVL